ncbi:DNA-binding response regulator [Desulfonema ishimotonii]|uniref:DNA-binding response regulator n=1 Tax=Desulfonema ishimotonii TaxID=45657 RepID=A0A401FW19_9BACT|nr:response regulator transcription factor [Desulfonema ishimotonii]GBC61167.1 DNA-binding response regulator [Desulfonema ishimotonii]
MPIEVLLADDHSIMRAGLRALLESRIDMTVTGEAQNGREALNLACEIRPDVVIMDVSMPGLNGVDATKLIIEALDTVRVIALSMHADRRFVEGMLMAGVSGYLLKDCVPEELVTAIRTVARGHIYLSPTIADTVVRNYLGHLSLQTKSPQPVLTCREREVVQLIAEGRGTKQIAATLHISPKTVETHRRRVMEKLELSSIADLIKFAIREGITSL